MIERKATPHVWNGYRVVWDLGWWLDYENADTALDLYCALSKLPAFQEEPYRPVIVPIRGGVLQFGPPPASGP